MDSQPPSDSAQQKNSVKFTIATVTYNAGNLIAKTIESVEQQDYPYVEHLIIDGNSSDNTLEQVHHYQERNSIAEVKHEVNCLSEPDEGIYDAMNKAIDLATGDYILFLNAGDTFFSSTTLSDIERSIAGEATLPAVVYGNTDIVDRDGNFIRHRRLQPPEILTWRSFRYGMLVCHQAFLARTDLAKANLYNLKYRFSADFDWCIRIMKEGQKRREKLFNSKLIIANFLNEGATKMNHKASLKERFRIMQKHYGFVATSALHSWFALRTIIKK